MTENSRHISYPINQAVRQCKNLEIDFPEGMSDWEKTKPERNALTAIVVATAFRNSYDAWQSGRRGEYGLLKMDNIYDGIECEEDTIPFVDSLSQYPLGGRHNPFYRYYFSHFLHETATELKHTLQYDIHQHLHKPPSDPQSEALIHRLNEITTEFVSKESEKKTFAFVGRGATTALSTLERFANLIPTLYRNEMGTTPAADEVAQILTNSTNTVLRLATGHLLMRIPMINTIINRHTQFMPEYFTFNHSTHGISIGANDKRWSQVETQQLSALQDTPLITTNCPALATSRNMPQELSRPHYHSVIAATTDWYSSLIASWGK